MTARTSEQVCKWWAKLTSRGPPPSAGPTPTIPATTHMRAPPYRGEPKLARAMAKPWGYFALASTGKVICATSWKVWFVGLTCPSWWSFNQTTIPCTHLESSSLHEKHAMREGQSPQQGPHEHRSRHPPSTLHAGQHQATQYSPAYMKAQVMMSGGARPSWAVRTMPGHDTRERTPEPDFPLARSSGPTSQCEQYYTAQRAARAINLI